ncbi:MAG TPA: hypothetical protein VNQ90_18760 [Chthoniobacteraceae bacterium]|nr:hypothetical protein [Chthoniobacteraceae bacterium]
MDIKVDHDGPQWPVDPRFAPVAAFGPDGLPAALSLDGDGKLLVAGNGGGGGGGGGAVTIADGADLALGAKADTAASDDTGAFSLIALQKRGLTHLAALLERSFGMAGGVYLADTAPATGAFGAVSALEDLVVASMDAPDLGGTLTNVPVPAGATIYGAINAITLASGKAIAYHR